MARTAPTDRSCLRLIATCAAAAGVALALQGCADAFAADGPGRKPAPVAFEAPETAPPAAPASASPAAPESVAEPATEAERASVAEPATAAKPAAASKPRAAAKPATGAKPRTAAKPASAIKRPNPKGAAAILRGERQVFVVPVRNEGTLAVSRAGRIELSDHFDDSALFVLTPTAGKHQIRTGKIRGGGEALCLSVRRNGTSPLTLATTGCDAGASSQLFTVTAAGSDTYSIAAAGGAYVRVSNQSGVIVEEVGDGPAPTAFHLVDQGKATLPALD